MDERKLTHLLITYPNRYQTVIGPLPPRELETMARQLPKQGVRVRLLTASEAETILDYSRLGIKAA